MKLVKKLLYRLLSQHTSRCFDTVVKSASSFRVGKRRHQKKTSYKEWTIGKAMIQKMERSFMALYWGSYVNRTAA